MYSSSSYTFTFLPRIQYTELPKRNCLGTASPPSSPFFYSLYDDSEVLSHSEIPQVLALTELHL